MADKLTGNRLEKNLQAFCLEEIILTWNYIKQSMGQIFKWSGWVVVVYVIAAIISREVYDNFFPGENILSIPRLIATVIPSLIAGVIFSRWFKKKAGVEEEE